MVTERSMVALDIDYKRAEYEHYTIVTNNYTQLRRQKDYINNYRYFPLLMKDKMLLSPL